MAMKKMLNARYCLGQFPDDLRFAPRIRHLHRDSIDAPSAQTGQGIFAKLRARRKQDAPGGVANFCGQPHARFCFLDR